MGTRQKSDGGCLTGMLAASALAGGLAGSWAAFVSALTLLLALALVLDGLLPGTDRGGKVGRRTQGSDLGWEHPVKSDLMLRLTVLALASVPRPSPRWRPRTAGRLAADPPGHRGRLPRRRRIRR